MDKQPQIIQACTEQQSPRWLNDLLLNTQELCYRRSILTGKFEYVSRFATERLGFKPGDHIDLPIISDIMHPEDGPRIVQIEIDARNGIKPTFSNIEYRIRFLDGQYHWLSENFSYIFDESGKAVAIIGNARDITDHKQLNEKLTASERRYKALYENANAALFRSCIHTGKVIECNSLLARLFGYDSVEECLKEMNAQNCYMDFSVREKFLSALKAYGEIQGWEVHVIRKDGVPFWVKVNARIFPEQGFVEGAAIDISSAKLLTKAELNVLEFTVQGLSNAQIAARLYKSVRTIEDQRASIMRKLRVKNAVELTRLAIQSGLVS